MRKSQVEPLDLRKAESANPDIGLAGAFLKSSEQNGISRWLTSGKPLFKLKMLAATLGLTFSALASAVGLGGINVISSMGQPLQAEIELVAVGREDKPSLVARLASPDAYKGAGIDYPYGVKFNFQIESRPNGQSYLKLSSNKEVNDPFVSLLVELSWSSGRLMREYTFLLDPPGYVAAQPDAAPVQAVAPNISHTLPSDESPTHSAPEPSTRYQQPDSAQVSEDSSIKEQAVEKIVKKRVRAETEKPVRQAKQVAMEEVEVASGDTLSKIAARVKSDDVSLERMLVAMYRANSDQFDGENMNRIRSGKILRMPDQDELMEVSQSEAVQEIHTQAADWNTYRQKLAGAVSFGGQSDTARQVSSGKITSTATDKKPVANESAKEVLRLSKGEAPGDKAASSGRGSAQDKLNSAAEDAIAKSKAESEEKARVELLESNLKDIQRLAELKSEAAALAVAASGVVAASQVAAVSAVVPSAPEIIVEGPSLVDMLLDYQLELGVGTAALLALGGLGVALRRRKLAPAKSFRSSDDEGEITGHMAVPVVPSPETGDFTSLVDHDEELVEDDVDPISEAELFLNFGRDEQAEEVLMDALQRTPDNHKLHLKLLGIYANRKDLPAFEGIARQLHESGDEEAIQEANTMGRKLDPSNSLYADPNAPVEDSDSAAMLDMMRAALHGEHEEATAEEAVDIPLESGEPEIVDDSVGSAGVLEAMDFDVTELYPTENKPGEVDFDVTSTSPAMPAPADSLDFDIGALGLDVEKQEEHEEEHEKETVPNLDDLIFDVTSPSLPKAAPEQKPAYEAEKDEVVDFLSSDFSRDELSGETLPADKDEPDNKDEGMEFMLDFPMDEIKSSTAASQPASIDLSEISLDMDETTEPGSEPVSNETSEHWQEVATKLDLAKAYQEMGDEVGAREILEEVLLEGDEGQRNEAQLLIDQLS